MQHEQFGGGNVQQYETVAQHLRKLKRRKVLTEDLVEYLEGTSGRVFHSREDLARYVAELREGGERAKKERRLGKNTGWLILLVVIFLQYFFVDLLLEVHALRSASSIAPVRSAGYRS